MIEKKQFVYRMVDDRGNVLYVGQHTGIHPGTRVARHKNKPWWHEVADWDFEEVTGDLNRAERDLIEFWGSYYNKENQESRAEYEAKPTVKLIFEAGQASGMYHSSRVHNFAGELKLIRTVLWRRDETEVPCGTFYSGTSKDFSQDWDFEDFPVLNPNGFIRSMGCFAPGGYKAAHPECAFELDYWPLATRDDYEDTQWEDWLFRVEKQGRISYTGVYTPKESRRPAA